MMVRKIYSLLLVFFVAVGISHGQESEVDGKGRALIFEGNDAYLSDDFKTAEDLYRKKLSESPDEVSKFNLGNALYKQGRFDESTASFQDALTGLSDEQKSSAYYNLGNSQFKEEKLKEALESYREAIQADAENLEARENMLKTKMIIKQQEQQQQQQQDQQDQEQQDQEEQQNQEQQQQDQQDQEHQENQEEQDQQQQQQEGEEEQEAEEEEGEQQAPQELTKEEAERLLQAIENEEKKIQEKLRKQNGNQVQPRKDW